MASGGAPDDDVLEIGAEEYDLEDDEDVSGKVTPPELNQGHRCDKQSFIMICCFSLPKYIRQRIRQGQDRIG